jgi:hypothetical protein
MKISSLLEERDDEDVFISFEYFPPRTPEGVTALYDRIEKMKAYSEYKQDAGWGVQMTNVAGLLNNLYYDDIFIKPPLIVE